MYAKFSKCKFCLKSVAFFRHIVSKEGVMIDPQKNKVVKNWVSLSSITKYRSFVGLARYCHRFVKNFVFIDTHMTNLNVWRYPFSGLKM